MNTNSDGLTNEWFTIKGTYKYGPFNNEEVIHMLQENLIFEYDLVWNKSLQNWTKIAELKDFTPEAIAKLGKTAEEFKASFYRRKHRRVKYEGKVLIHDGDKMWTADTLEISPGGTGLIMTQSALDLGSEVHIHFKPGSDVPPFNAVCRVVNLHKIESKGSFRYGLKFTSLEPKIYKLLEKQSKAKEAA